MSDTMKELLIKQQENMTNKIVGYALLVLAAGMLLGTIFVNPFLLAGVVVCPIISYVVYFRKMSVEYEYTYLDKEIRVDRIYNLNKRKQVDVFDINKIEILAVKGSASLGSFVNRQGSKSDYSVGADTEETKVYEMWYEGQRKIYLSLSDDFLTPVVRFIPHKVKKQ